MSYPKSINLSMCFAVDVVVVVVLCFVFNVYN